MFALIKTGKKGREKERKKYIHILKERKKERKKDSIHQV